MGLNWFKVATLAAVEITIVQISLCLSLTPEAYISFIILWKPTIEKKKYMSSKQGSTFQGNFCEIVV